MTDQTIARNTVRAYYDAWTRGDMAGARSRLADALDFQGPIDRFNSADPFVAALTGFAGMLTRADLLQEMYGENEAALLYDCVTASPAGTIRTAEFFRLQGDKIASIRLVFDATELRKLMGR